MHLQLQKDDASDMVELVLRKLLPGVELRMHVQSVQGTSAWSRQGRAVERCLPRTMLCCGAIPLLRA